MKEFMTKAVLNSNGQNAHSVNQAVASIGTEGIELTEGWFLTAYTPPVYPNQAATDRHHLAMLQRGSYHTGEFIDLMSFSTSMFPGCCGILVIHDCHQTSFSMRYAGTDKVIFPTIRKIARRAGYTEVQYTFVDDQTWIAEMLKKDGWTFGTPFRSIRTSNSITVASRKTED